MTKPERAEPNSKRQESRSIHLWIRVRELLKSVKEWMNRVLHPLRRAAAIRRLHRAPLPRRILILCDGNICRSPYAAARLRQLLGSGDSVEIASAGLMGPDRVTPEEGLEVASARGLNLTSHRSRLAEAESARDSDLVLVMTPTQARFAENRLGVASERVLLLGDLDTEAASRRSIVDPFGQPLALYEESYDRIDRSLKTLSLVLRSKER